MTAPRPTGEQQAIIDASQGGADLVIEAGAGTGKTSTLHLVATTQPRRRGLYVAYNQAIATDAKRSFPASVTCATAHSLAFRAVGRRYAPPAQRPPHAHPPDRQGFGHHPPPGNPACRFARAPAGRRLVMETVTRFCHSDAAQFEPWHVPKPPGRDGPASVAVLREALVPLAQRAWIDLSDTEGRLRFTHDCYLKLWQLADPRMPADYVLLDEAQDANPVVAAILERQTHTQRILVGDRCH